VCQARDALASGPTSECAAVGSSAKSEEVRHTAAYRPPWGWHHSAQIDAGAVPDETTHSIAELRTSADPVNHRMAVPVHSWLFVRPAGYSA
jgi:hypothetical protein